MAKIEFSKPEKELVVRKVQMYFREELDQELGQFDAEFLLDFIAEEVGAYFYNRGLRDAQAVIEAKVADISDALYEIEKPTLTVGSRVEMKKGKRNWKHGSHMNHNKDVPSQPSTGLCCNPTLWLLAKYYQQTQYKFLVLLFVAPFLYGTRK